MACTQILVWNPEQRLWCCFTDRLNQSTSFDSSVLWRRLASIDLKWQDDLIVTFFNFLVVLMYIYLTSMDAEAVKTNRSSIVNITSGNP